MFQGDLHLGRTFGADLLLAQLASHTPREEAEPGFHAQEANLEKKEQKMTSAKLNLSEIIVFW